MAAAFLTESDSSSIISVSDRLMPSDSEAEDLHTDKQKYRLPDVGKAKGFSRNGFVLQDGAAVRGDCPPIPPPKDPPSYRNSYVSVDGNDDGPPTDNSDLESYFNPSRLSRAGSIYTLSRASFTNQISQLTSIKLPQASSLSSSIAAIPTSTGAARALLEASQQIRVWIQKASEVLNGLDAEDDVEWAAAGGREGLGDVDAAVRLFESLIDVYVSAIEQLEARSDIDSLNTDELQRVVERMDQILEHWNQIKVTLRGVKEQVEVAMEWEELWNTVLGEINQEVESINRIIFEMEERRHRGMLDAMAESGHQIDITELETIVEEAPSRAASATAAGARMTNTLASVGATTQSLAPQTFEEDKNLVRLFARLQPLRASLDFLPMRLSTFVMRAKTVFPTGCEELERRREYLEEKYNKLEADAESLRKELGEDRWVIIFRKASRQALKMCDSVERSVIKLQEALDEGAQHSSPASLAKKIDNYDAKKEHYGPAIQQVLAIINKGVQTRLTVNGEILRLQADMVKRWTDLEAHTKGLDWALDSLQLNKAHLTLRDSISTILSEQRSVSSSAGGAMLETPGTSPASSVVLLSRQGSEQDASTPYAKSRQGSFTSTGTTRSHMGKWHTSVPASMENGQSSSIPRKTPLSRSSVSEVRPSMGVSSRLYSPPTRTESRSMSRSEMRMDNRSDRPRWNGSTNLKDTALGHNFKPLSATTPSPYRKGVLPRTPRSVSTPQPSPLGRSLGRPPTALPFSSALSTPPLSMPRLRPQASTPAISHSHLSNFILPSESSNTASTPPSNTSSTLQQSMSHLPGVSMYMAPSSMEDYPTTPVSTSGQTTSSTSTATLTNQSQKTNTTFNFREIEEEDSPMAGAQPSDEPSPTARPLKNRPSTSMAGRRISMIPQPKRTISGLAEPSHASPGSGRLSRAGGRISSLGDRMSTLSGRISSFGMR